MNNVAKTDTAKDERPHEVFSPVHLDLLERLTRECDRRRTGVDTGRVN